MILYCQDGYTYRSNSETYSWADDTDENLFYAITDMTAISRSQHDDCYLIFNNYQIIYYDMDDEEFTYFGTLIVVEH